MFRGICPDNSCKFPVVYSSESSVGICLKCGQKHDIDMILDKIPLSSLPPVIEQYLLQYEYNERTANRVGKTNIIEMGYSNYYYKILSPFTMCIEVLVWIYYKHSKSKIKPMTPQLKQTLKFEYKMFCLSSFRLDPCKAHLKLFGIDKAAKKYLDNTLDLIGTFNNNKKLVPLYVDGDGDCLLHAVSRAVIGRPLLWYPFRVGLMNHLIKKHIYYKRLLENFIDDLEWLKIVRECDPYYVPQDGFVGLQNVHILCLSNMLKRPIILLDNLKGMESCAEYSATFLPAFNSREKCTVKGKLNPPLFIAWSNSARNHFVPLVGIKDDPILKFPRNCLPKVWAFSQDLLETYFDFSEDDFIMMGGNLCFPDEFMNGYLTKLDLEYTKHNRINPSFVSDVVDSYLKFGAMVDFNNVSLIKSTLRLNLYHKCLICNNINNVSADIGRITAAIKNKYGTPRVDRRYIFPILGIAYRYEDINCTVYQEKAHTTRACAFCSRNSLRQIDRYCRIKYKNGDVTVIPSSKKAVCPCGFKHYYDGEFYDNVPQLIHLEITWKGRTVTDTVYWFQYETFGDCNSDLNDVTIKLKNKHFPDENDDDLLSHIQMKVLEKLTNDSLLDLLKTDDAYKDIFKVYYKNLSSVEDYEDYLKEIEIEEISQNDLLCTDAIDDDLIHDGDDDLDLGFSPITNENLSPDEFDNEDFKIMESKDNGTGISSVNRNEKPKDKENEKTREKEKEESGEKENDKSRIKGDMKLGKSENKENEKSVNSVIESVAKSGLIPKKTEEPIFKVPLDVSKKRKFVRVTDF